MTLTKFEFSEILGLKADSDFISHMFKSVDRDGNGFIEYQEFLDFFFMMSEGMVYAFSFESYDTTSSKMYCKCK